MNNRILVAEDDPDNRRIVQKALEHDGYEVTAVGDGLSLLDECRRLHPDVLVLDLELPRLDGYEAVRRLRAISGFERMPVIAVTGNARRGDEERARRLGCDDYLTKPCRPGLIREKVRYWIAGL